jgi:CHAT domain-containing protein/tetratricopeptide (TPR) repeat protein
MRGAGLCAIALLGACGGGASKREVLEEYRAVIPRRQVVQPVWLASATTDELYGRLSPDGRRLVYASNQKGSLDIWVKDLTTGLPRRLTSHVTTETQPAWSPDGKRVVFVSMRLDVKGDAYLWDDGELTRLTDRHTADSYPTFSADGRAVFLASGPEGMSRIERLDLASKRREPVTDYGATHPAVSPDGKLLAFTLFDRERRGRIAVVELGTRKVSVLTTGDYHAGFPAFSPDGRRLAFSRFLGADPGKPLTDETNRASLWAVDVGRALRAGSARAAEALARPLTSGRHTVLFVQDTRQGLVFTSSWAGSLDVGLLPRRGPFPALRSAREQLELALSQREPRDRLLGLQLAAMGRGEHASRALYLLACLQRELGELHHARKVLRRLASESAMAHGEWSYLAQIDEVALDAEAAQARGDKSGAARTAARALKKLSRLELPKDPPPRVAAHLLLRRGDLQRLGGRIRPAMKSYGEVIRRFGEVRDHAVEARFHQGELFERLGRLDRRALSTYYLGLFRRYPDQTAWLGRSAAAVLRLHSDLEPAAEVERLRALCDAHPDLEIFGAVAQIRIGKLYETLDRLDLAIAAMVRVTGLKGAATARERTEAAFELGRLSLAKYDRLREKGRLSEALAFYDKALGAYARVLKRFERGHENNTRARTEFVRLSLLMAAQLERDGELALSEKRYRALLELEPDNLQAHRKLIQFSVRRGERDALIERYEERVDRDPGDHVGHYALGYLATFSKPLEASDLDRAEKHLQRAVGLYPKSPFGHMTLGWVYEMRERALGQVARGRLEEADLYYDRAFNLNDARLDVQTEADLLINRCNTFANLGNKWDEAYTFCHRRYQLKIPFVSKKRAVSFNMTYGRAASATGRHGVADEALERALDLARDLNHARLEAEAVARLGLSALLQGRHRRSNRYFKQALELFRTQGRTENLAALRRSMAVNLARRGQQREAFVTLAEAARLLDEYGTPAIEDYNPLTARCGKLCTTAPYGFEDQDEAYVSRALKEHMQGSRGAWPEVAAALSTRIASREEALKERKHDELARELLLLENDLALTRLRMGDAAGAGKSLDRALSSLTKMLSDEEEKEKEKEEEQAKKKKKEEEEKGKEDKNREKAEQAPRTEEATLFPLQVALALNRAEGAIARLAAGEAAAADELAGARELLERIEARRAAATPREGDGPLPPRLRLALWTDLGLLSFQGALRRPTARAAVGAKPGPGAGLQPAERGLRELTQAAAPLVAGVRWMRQVLKATDPAAALQVDPLVREDRIDRARRMGVLEPLWRPLSFQDRLRWHVMAGLNLARMTSAFTPRDRLSTHPGTELVRELAALGLRHELGALRFAVSAELAYRRDDLRAMEAAVRGFLDRTALLLDGSYLSDPRGAARHRDLIFGRAVQLALEHDDIRRAVAWAEQRERRAFQDELCALGPVGWGRARKPLAALLAAARDYRRQLAREPVEPPPAIKAGPTSQPAPALPPSPARQAWRARLNKLEHGVQGRLQALRAASPRVAALFAPVPAFPEPALLGALEKDRDVAVTAVVDGPRRLLVALAPGGEPRVERLKASAPAALRAALARLVEGRRRVYVDLGRLDPGLSPRGLLPGRVKGVRLATLWELVDAHERRNLALSGRLVVDPRPESARRLARALGRKGNGVMTLTGEQLSLEKGIDRRLERAGVLVWSGPARFDGGLSTNLRLLLHDPEGTRLRDLRPARALGLPLRGHLLVLAGVRHTPGMARAERVALSRLFHTMGVPSILTYADVAALGRELKPALDSLRKADLPGALGRRSSAVLWGYGGMEPDEAAAFAKKMLDGSARAGVVAFKRRRMTDAVEHLEGTLRYMEYTGDLKYQEGALEFLAQAYTLLEDYARAVPLQKRLLELREQAIKESPAKKKLAAQAKWVKAVKDMAWLRLRNEQYDRALEANMRAIQLYKQVKRPLLALDSYEQRAIIAEKKKDNRQALDYARRALATARRQLAQKPKDGKAGLKVAATARRVARLERMLFSNYRAALEAARVALSHTPKVEPTAPEELSANIKPLMAQRKQLMAKKPPTKADKAKLAALTGKLKGMLGRRALMDQALGARVQGMLEVARIQGARGDYNRAVQEAERALELAKAAKLPEQEAALLELVNNLYYTGAHGPALARASEGLQRTKAPRRRIQFHNARGTVYAALGQTERALKELSSALDIATRLNEPTEMAASHNNIGNALRLAGRFAEARRAFKQALELDLRQEDKLGIAFDHANLGLTFELMGRQRDARRHLKQALQLSKKIGAPLGELKALAGLGRIELAAGRAEPARALFREGLTRASTLGLRAWIWRYDLLLGRALRRLGRVEPARRALDAGVRIIEAQPPRLRKALGTPRVEEQPEDLYDELVDLLVAAGKTDAAFDLGERQRGRAVVDLLGQKSAELPVAKTRELITRITGLSQELEAARAAESRAGASRRGTERQEVQRVQKELLEARAALAAVNPRLPRLVMTDTLPLARLRGKLPEAATILSYVPTRDRLLIFALRRGAPVRAIPVRVDRARLTRAVERYREALLRFHPVEEMTARLHGWLVAPVQKAMGSLPERLIVVPGGPLHLVSFAALRERGAEPLVARHTVSYLASVNALAAASNKKMAGTRTSFGWAGGAGRPLSFVVRESEVFAATFAGATTLQGKEATRSRFLAEAPRAGLLHVATHAEFRPESPLSTALELADGELPLLEVLGLELSPGALVILSACETGTGPLDGADAVVGLHRAFRAAGAGQVISSLWRVSDLGAALTMKHLFRGLGNKLTPARALRAAQNTLRKRFPHPAFWAAFRLDGAP